jgi:hypothetical protein
MASDIKEFAIRVERLCEFLLARLYSEVGRNGSDEQKILEDLRDEASDIQVSSAPIRDTLTGLKDFMGGLPEATKEP